MRTGYYTGHKADHGVPVRTSVGAPHWWKGDLIQIRRLTPYGAFGHDDWQERYAARLDRIDPESLRQRLDDLSAEHGGRPLVLLCHCKQRADCHRDLLARWLEERGFGPVPEAGEVQTTLDLGGQS